MAGTTIHTLNYKVIADSQQFTKGIVAARGEASLLKKVMAETEAPLDKVGAAFNRLDKLWESGSISAEVYTAAAAKLNAEYQATTPEALAAAEATEKHNKAMEDGAKLAEQLATPMEKHAARLGDLDELLKQGAINEGLYARGVERATEDLRKATGETDRLARSEAFLAEKIDRAKAVFAETRTPMERYQQDLRELDDLLKRGAIDQETFNRGVAKAGEKHAGSPFKGKPDAAGDPMQGLEGVLGNTGIGRMVTQFKALGPAAAGAAVVIGGWTAIWKTHTAALDFVVDAYDKASERIDKVSKTAERLGVATDALMGLRHAAESNGVAAEAFDGHLEKMTSNIGKAAQEGGKAAEPFARLGLDLKDLADQSPDKSFIQIAEAIGEIKNPAEQSAAAVAIFGKSGQELLNLFKGGAAGIKEAQEEAEAFGLTVSTVDAKTIERTNDNFARLSKIVEGAGNAIAVELAPAVEFVTGLIISQVKEWGGVKDAVGTFATVAVAHIGALIDAMALFVPGLKQAVQILTGKEFSGKAFVAGFEEIKKSAAEASAEAVKNREATAALNNEFAKTEALDDFIKKIEKQRAALTGDGASEIDALKSMGLSSEQIDQATEALRKFNEEKLAKETSDDARKFEEALQKELDLLNGISEHEQKIADLRDRGVDTTRIEGLQAEIDKTRKLKELEEDTAKARKKRDDEARAFTDDLLGKNPNQMEIGAGKINDALRSGIISPDEANKALKKLGEDSLKSVMDAVKTPAERIDDKLQEDLAKLKDAQDAGLITPEEEFAAGEKLRKKRDEDLQGLKKQDSDPFAGAAMRRGSAEAFASIFNAASGGKDKNPQAKVEENTKQIADNTGKIADRIQELKDTVGKNMMSAGF